MKKGKNYVVRDAESRKEKTDALSGVGIDSVTNPDENLDGFQEPETFETESEEDDPDVSEDVSREETVPPAIPEMFEPYQVEVATPYLNVRKGPGTNHDKCGKFTGIGIFTVVKEAEGEGSSAGWGLLEEYAEKEDGWISLEYATRIKDGEGNNVHT